MLQGLFPLVLPMEKNTSTDTDSDPSTQTCNRCGLEKPIEQFVARTKMKRLTKWCLDCRIYGNEGHNRWAARKKRRAEGVSTPPSQDKVETSPPSMGSPEGTKPSIPTHMPYIVYPGHGYPTYIAHAPGPYGHNPPFGAFQPPGGFQIVTPPLNSHSMHSAIWGYSPPIPIMESPQRVPSNDFSPRPPAQESDQASTQASEAEESSDSSSDNESLSDESSDSEHPAKEMAQKISTEGICSDDEGHVCQHQPDDPNTFDEEEEEIDDILQGEKLQNLQREEREDLPGHRESSTAPPYFICVACCTARPKRLEDSGICVYCFEHPTQYCIKGGHEDDNISFVDSDGQWHEVCNQCRSNPDPT